MDQQPQQTDVFAWAMHTAGFKDSLSVELFLFNKKYTVYTANFAQDLTLHLKQLFLIDLVNYIANGADQGLVVRTFEEAEAENNVIQRTELGNVENAAYILQQIEESLDEVMPFSDEEHDFKRIKGFVVRFSHESLPKPFYVVKLLQQSQVLKAKTSWMIRGNNFQKFDADAALKIAPDNQVLITGDDIFVFNQRKFESLFGYNAKQQYIAKQKVAEIEKSFKLSFPEGVDMQAMVKDKKRTINKLQKLELAGITQEKLLDHAEEMGVDLMTDDAGAIIIMDSAEMDKFVNLLNDDYIESQLTGNKYEIRGKKPIEPEE